MSGYPHISLPTLGTQYELNSLLSINTIGRKSSAVSQVSQPVDVFDGRVSRYIDADVSNILNKDDSYGEDPRNFTLQTILDMTSDNVLSEDVHVSPPKAEPEQFTSRPMSVVEVESLAAPSLHQPSPSPQVEVESLAAPPLHQPSPFPQVEVESLQAPTLHLTPPSPSPQEERERPRSTNFDQPPDVPVKVRPGHSLHGSHSHCRP